MRRRSRRVQHLAAASASAWQRPTFGAPRSAPRSLAPQRRPGPPRGRSCAARSAAPSSVSGSSSAAIVGRAASCRRPIARRAGLPLSHDAQLYFSRTPRARFGVSPRPAGRPRRFQRDRRRHYSASAPLVSARRSAAVAMSGLTVPTRSSPCRRRDVGDEESLHPLLSTRRGDPTAPSREPAFGSRSSCRFRARCSTPRARVHSVARRPPPVRRECRAPRRRAREWRSPAGRPRGCRRCARGGREPAPGTGGRRRASRPPIRARPPRRRRRADDGSRRRGASAAGPSPRGLPTASTAWCLDRGLPLPAPPRFPRRRRRSGAAAKSVRRGRAGVVTGDGEFGSRAAGGWGRGPARSHGASAAVATVRTGGRKDGTPSRSPPVTVITKVSSMSTPRDVARQRVALSRGQGADESAGRSVARALPW